MNYLAIAWKIVKSRPAIALGAALAGALFAGHLGNWRHARALESTPVVLEQTKAAEKAERRELTPEEATTLCAGLQPIVGGKALETSHKRRSPALPGKAPQRGGEFSKLAGGLGPAPLLDVLKLPELPHGGEVEVTLPAGAAAPVLEVFPTPRPWLEGMSRWRISALAGAPLTGDRQERLLVVPSIDWKFARTGRIDHGAGVAFCPARAVVAGYRLGLE